jgi:hypothetical protein
MAAWTTAVGFTWYLLWQIIAGKCAKERLEQATQHGRAPGVGFRVLGFGQQCGVLGLCAAAG